MGVVGIFCLLNVVFKNIKRVFSTAKHHLTMSSDDK